MKNFTIIFFLLIASCASAQQIKKVKVTELENIIKESKGPMIISFWATYCVPCIQELPYFHDAVNRYKSKGLSLLLVSLDLREAYPTQISLMAKKLKFTAPVVWLDETNADYFCPKVDSSWSGALPASLFINNATGYRSFYEDQVPKEKLEQEIKKMLAARD
jgi:thiol-disulfide isomerase/thioredoxin